MTDAILARWDAKTELVLTRDFRARRNNTDWLVHFRANAPANYGLGVSDDVFRLIVDFAAGKAADFTTDEQLKAEWSDLFGYFIDSGFLISTTYELNAYGLKRAAIHLDVEEIFELRKRINIDDLGLFELECVLLYALVRENPFAAPICELGSMFGGSTIALAIAAKRSGHHKRVLAIDDHEWHRHIRKESAPKEAVAALPSTLPSFKENIAAAGVADTVDIIVQDTVRAAEHHQSEISLLFIDANHTLKAVQADFDAWFPKLVAGGIVVFHDYGNSNWPDIKVVVDNLLDRFSYFTVYQTLAIGVKG